MTGFTGRRVLVTRPRAQARALTDALAARGATPVVFPAIEIRPVADLTALDAAINRLDDFSWITFTSANAVQYFFDRAAVLELNVPPHVRIAAVGSVTARALSARGTPVHFVPGEFRAEQLGNQLPDVSGRQVLLPCATGGREEGVLALRRRGAVVQSIAVYETHRAEPTASEWAELDRHLHAATFTSSSAVEHFFTLAGERAHRVLSGVIIACIGPVTGDAARAHGVVVQVQPHEYTVAALVTALETYFSLSVARGYRA